VFILAIKIVQYGVGSIGQAIVKLALEKNDLKIVGAIDIDPTIVNKDLGEVISRKKMRITISNDVKSVISTSKPDVVINTTSSYLENVFPQIEQCVSQKVHVISTCEELSYPYFKNKDIAKKIDLMARDAGVTVLGTGINPGFLMDTLAITLTGVCKTIRSIKIKRVLNASKRREPFQKKIGAGLSVQEFKKRIMDHKITGHVGLPESLAMIANALGWQIDKIEESIPKPLVTRNDVVTQFVKVLSGQVVGVGQDVKGVIGGKEVITLIMEAFVGTEEEYDSVSIDGEPPINQKISPCVHGDIGTAAIVINTIPLVVNSTPGLKTMIDMPVPRFLS
jgi:4-hydroxy-tetrahydrodipicolinate reductase